MRNPLLLREVFDCVLEHLDFPYDGLESTLIPFIVIEVHEPWEESRKTLFALARTCRAISEPSLDLLWRSLGSIKPITRLFMTVQCNDSKLTVVPPSPAEWAIIHKYAVRVKELFVLPSLRDASHYSVLHHMPQPPPIFSDPAGLKPSCLLPNLKVLVWGQSYPNSMHLIERLLAPGLISLDITLRGSTDSSLSLFDRFALMRPNLKALRWHFLEYEPREEEIQLPDIVNELSSLVLRLGKIQSLDILVPFDHATLKHLILSPNIKTLSMMLDHPESEVEKISIPLTQTPPFPNVEKIELHVWDFYFVASLLRPHLQHFRSVDLILRVHWPGVLPIAESLHLCFAALATPQRAGSLESFILSVHENDWESMVDTSEVEGAPNIYSFTFNTLSPFAAFRNLLTLRISIPNRISINDDELVTLARSWPALRVLYLDGSSGWWPCTSAKYATLRGLLALIEVCPRLEGIWLPIDARDVPMDASPDIRGTAIWSVGFPDSLISEPRLVAEFIRKHLPSAKPLYPKSWIFTKSGGAAEYLAECQKLWIEVGTML